MNVRRLTVLGLAVLILAVPAVWAGTVSFTVSDNLGPAITPPGDPLLLAGNPFSLTGTVTQGAQGQTSYTVDTLTVTAASGLLGGQSLTLIACGTSGAPAVCAGDTTIPTLTLTTSSATLMFDVGIQALSETGTLTATVNLPAGTFEDTNGMISLANFSDVQVQAGSTLNYSAGTLVGEVGVNGTASMSGFIPPQPPPPGVPEPGTIALMAGGLLCLIFRKRLHA